MVRTVRQKKMQMINGGIYRDNLPNGIKDVININIEYTSLAIIAYTREWLTLLKQDCGVSTEWKIDKMQNVTATGCQVIGIKLPNKVSAIVRVDGTNKLYIKEFSSGEAKSTYFTKNLVACSTVTDNYVPVLTTTERSKVTRPRVIPIDPDVIKKLTKSSDKDSDSGNVGSHASRLHSQYFITILVIIIVSAVNL